MNHRCLRVLYVKGIRHQICSMSVQDFMILWNWVGQPQHSSSALDCRLISCVSDPGACFTAIHFISPGYTQPGIALQCRIMAFNTTIFHFMWKTVKLMKCNTCNKYRNGAAVQETQYTFSTRTVFNTCSNKATERTINHWMQLR